MAEKFRLTEIWIYPVKSLGGLRLKEAEVLPKGLAFDRRWMLMDEDGIFMTQRVYPEMARYEVQLHSGQLLVRYDGEQIMIPFEVEGEVSETKVWDDPVKVQEVNATVSEWFSHRLDKKVKLVFFPEKNERLVDPRYAREKENVSLADGYPLLMIGEASLEDLNQKLKKTVLMNRFRPNIVIAGTRPYEEETWKDFRIGDVHLRGAKPCTRCVMTTVDQERGIRTGPEPLATLATYRKVNNKVLFGQNVLVKTTGYLREGDEIYRL